MKVLITTDWYDPVINGVVTSVHTLMKELENRGHEVRVLTLSRNHRSYKEDNIYYAGSAGAGRIYPEARFRLTVPGKYVRELIQWEPDLIHSQCEFFTFFPARKIARELHIPMIHTYHTIYEDYTHYFTPKKAWGRNVVRRMTRRLSRQVSGIIVPSEKVFRILEEYSVECPLWVVPSGIDLFRFSSPEAGGLAVIILCIWLFAGKCRERRAAVLLSAVFVFPVFPWLLNGGLYARSKVFVPFLPLMSFLCARFFEGLGAKMENLRSCAAAKDVGTDRNGNRRFTRESLIFGYIAGAFVLILGSGDLSRKGEALAIFADLLLCGAGLLFISAGSKADSLTCPGLCQMLRWFSIHLPAAGSLTVWKKRNRERRRQNFAVLLTICTMAVVCVVEIMGTQNTRVSRQELAEIYDADVRESVRSLLAGEARPVRLEVRGSRSYEKANQNRVLVPGQNLTTCYSSFENAAYTRFRKNIGLVRYTRNCLMQDAQNNPLFLRFMGVKYLVGGKKVPGWEKIKGDGASAIYRNDRTAPLAYLTDQTISSETFESLSWQEKQIVLLEAAAVPEKDGTQEKLPAERQRKEGGEAGRHPAERKVTIQETQNENGFVISKGDGFRIKADKEVKTEAVLDQKTQKGDYVFLSFRVENHRPSKDVTVTVNGVRNKLSSTATEYYNGNEVFHYTLALPEGTQRLSISFGAGDYEIRKLACCVGQVDEAKNGTLYANPADLQLSTSGNGYTGAIQAEEDQWLITSIPYDKSLSIYVDGICLKTESVNGGFAGAKVPAGIHWIEIRYQAPGSRLGMLLSGAAILGLCIWKIGRKRTEKTYKYRLGDGGDSNEEKKRKRRAEDLFV